MLTRPFCQLKSVSLCPQYLGQNGGTTGNTGGIGLTRANGDGEYNKTKQNFYLSILFLIKTERENDE